MSQNRRTFICRSAAFALGAPFALSGLNARAESAHVPAATVGKAQVAIVPCRTYGPEVSGALRQCFDLVGGVDKLVRHKTVTIKLNLTGTNFTWFLGRPVGETFMTHSATVMALLSLLFAAGASRVRLVESTQSQAALPESLIDAGWDVKAISALGKVEYENTRNLGDGKAYAHLTVPSGGYMFSSFELNHAYHDTDVMISLAKLKRHVTAGVTLSMKNMFGLTPNSLYGGEAGSEKATDGRGPLHSPTGYEKIKLPGLKEGVAFRDPFSRVPRIVVDLCGARPVDLAIIDGISAMTGGEGPWCSQAVTIKRTTPGVLIAGLNPVSTDAVATAVMGYNPRAPKGTRPFDYCDNTLLLAEQAGLGTADLAQIDVRGLSVDKARYPYD
ncbi:MAG TPA: DUF362 domain-containing protein [Candidatus Saccharimonadales bacterium]|nr:DUF362 domain-containing protein [Candidatus Saccharimonadales bacterium]